MMWGERAIRRSRGGALILAVSLALALELVAGIGSPAQGASVTFTSKKLTTYRTCILTAKGAGTTSAFDSYVDETAANVSTNYGTATTLSIQSFASVSGMTTTPFNNRTFIDFDLTKCPTAIPSSATVTNGTLKLYVTAIPSACETYDAHRVTASWTETGITWSNKPAAAAGTTGSATVGPATCGITSTGQYVSWDVTADAGLFVAGTSNFGWMIQDHTEDSTTARTATFSASDLNNLAQSPQLIVTYYT